MKHEMKYEMNYKVKYEMEYEMKYELKYEMKHEMKFFARSKHSCTFILIVLHQRSHLKGLLMIITLNLNHQT